MEIKKHSRQNHKEAIPSGWEIITLSEIFEFKNGLSKEKKFFGHGTPIVNYMDVYKKSGLHLSDLKGKVQVSHQEIKNFEVRKGDVFFTRTSETIEEIGITSVMLDDAENTVFSGFVLRARTISDKLDLNYKKYCFSTNAVRKEITSKSSYTTRALTNGRLLSSVHLLIPSDKKEQESIAAAIADTDRLIEFLEKLISKKKLIKQGAMAKLLKPQKNWEVKQIKDIATIIGGGTPSTQTKSFWNGDIDWFTPTEIGTQKYVTSSLRKITKEGLINTSAHILPVGAILLTTRAGIGDVAILKSPSCTNQGFQSLIANDGISYEFLYYLVSTLKPVLLRNASGSTFLEISPSKIRQIEVQIPDFDEQEKIADILSDIDKELDALEVKLNKYKLVKIGMMQQLLTGQIRLIEHQTEEVKTVPITKEKKATTGHNKQINEAVLISVLVDRYGNEKFPLSRFRYTKFLYLFHRYVEKQAEGFLKKAAGPYNPSNRYSGPEKIAITNKYIKPIETSKFLPNDNIDKAKKYFSDWYEDAHLEWLDKFKYAKNDELELLTTVDMAMEDLRKDGKDINVVSVKGIIASNKEWKAKLDKPYFSDVEISKAIDKSKQLFS